MKFHTETLPSLYHAWDCEAERQIQNPPGKGEFERMNEYEPTERELAFRGKQRFRHNQHKDRYV